MKIDAKVLKKYMDKVSLNNTISTTHLKFTDEGVISSVSIGGGIAMTIGLLKKEIFEDYEVITELFIRNNKFFSDILSTFKDKIEFEMIENHTLKIFDEGREAHIMLAEESICDNIVKRVPPNKTTVSLELNKDDIAQTIKDINLLKISNINISVKNKELIFQIGKKREYDYIKNTIKYDTDEDISVNVGNTICDFFNTLEDDFTLNIGTDVPLIMEEKTEQMNVTTIIAPIVLEK